MSAQVTRLVAAVAAVVCLSPDPARAGWVCIRNDTPGAVVLQEVTDAPPARRGKPVRLLPGEVYREYQPLPGEKKLEAYAGLPPTLVFRDKFTWGAADEPLSLHVVDGVVRLDPVPPPVPAKP